MSLGLGRVLLENASNGQESVSHGAKTEDVGECRQSRILSDRSKKQLFDGSKQFVAFFLIDVEEGRGGLLADVLLGVLYRFEVIAEECACQLVQYGSQLRMLGCLGDDFVL